MQFVTMNLNPDQIQKLWTRFHGRIHGFKNFQEPGSEFVEKEAGYKRKMLDRFKRDLGASGLSELIAAGKGTQALKEIDRLLTSNIVNFRAWERTFGKTDTAICSILNEYLRATSAKFAGPETLKEIFSTTANHGAIPSWDAVSTLLWALRPDDYFPIKISYYRKLGLELGHEMPHGRPNAEKFYEVIEFGRAFWRALTPQHPSDWVDVQSFIWCVCPDEEMSLSEDGPTYQVKLAVPFSKIFNSAEEARWAFELLGQTLAELGLKNDEVSVDKRIALTIPQGSGELKIRLNFGNWALLTFFPGNAGEQRVEFICRKGGQPKLSILRNDNSFAEMIDGDTYSLVRIGIEEMRDPVGEAEVAFKEALKKVARRFSDWKSSPFRAAHEPKLIEMLLDEKAREKYLYQGFDMVVPVKREIGFWWLNANPKIWDIEAAGVGEKQLYTSHNEKGNKRQKYKYFQEVKPGDLLIGYVTNPQKEIVAICKVTKGLHKTDVGDCIEFEKVEQLSKPVSYHELKANKELEDCEPLVSNQGSLFRVTETEYEIIRSLIDEADERENRVEIESYPMEQALEGLFCSKAQFGDMLLALKEKKNLILQGVPGVGKTFVAKRVAMALIGNTDPSRVEMVQFHQSYSYEDFVMGFKPSAKGGFELRYGIFHQFCRKAQRAGPQAPYVFIIDEINRGNLSKVFGELMMLIEPDKRGKEYALPLAYAQDSDERFFIPENVFLIGMMNTADRSLAMVDYALRRRFRFVTLRPEFESACFQSHLTEKGVPSKLIKRIVQNIARLNSIIAEDTKNLGPGFMVGHSYFCPQPNVTPDEHWYERVITLEIMPLLCEYWFDDENKVQTQKNSLLE